MKKLLLFLMVTIPILVVLVVKLTASVAVGDVFVSVQSVTLNPSSIVAMIGDSADLSYEIYPKYATNKEVEWHSDNEKSATVDANGHVEFVGIGSGYISAVTQDGNMRAQCYFHVYDTKVHQVQLTAPQNYVHIGKTLQLTATILPSEALNKEILFSSSDEGKATVDSNGLVTGIQEGYVTITATSQDGSYTDFVNLLVSKPVTGLVVDKTEIITASQTIQAEFKIEPFDATNKNVTFSVDNSEVAQINHLGRITFLKPGEVNITIKTNDGGFERTVKYIYTGGYAYDLILQQQFIEMNIDEGALFIQYNTLPENFNPELTNLRITSDDESVAYVDASGYLNAVKGGSTVVRIRANKNADEVIEKQIYVNVISPAEDIEIQDAITAEPTFQLQPKSLPESSTNTSYFYHIDDTETATVSDSGLVTFLTDSPCTVMVTVYANKDYSAVARTVYITYTAGGAGDFELKDKDIELKHGQKAYLNYTINPTNCSVKPQFSVVYNNPKIGGKVVEIADDGAIVAVGSGTAKVCATITLYDNTVVTEYCDITVVRDAEQIEINLDLEYYNYQYVTGQYIVPFSGTVSPLDATDTKINWSISDRNIAFISENTLIFYQAGYVTLTASVGNISNSVEIYYTGANPVFGQVEAIFDDEHTTIPEKISLGESFDVVISEVIPNNITNPLLNLQVKNQHTANESGIVLKIEGNTVTGVAGGTATLVANISSSIWLSFSILVEKLPESVSVFQANTQVTTSTVNLVSSVLPYDATNQKVRYVVKNTDIATVEGSVLTFKQNGIAHITAICEAKESITYDFDIEKVEKDIVYFKTDQTNLSVNKGDVLMVETDDDYSVTIINESAIVDGQQVARVEGKYIRTLSAGTFTAQVSISGQVHNILIQVKQLVEEITLSTKMDKFDGEYVVGCNAIDLSFEVLPTYADNKDIKLSIISSKNDFNDIAYLNGTTLHFTTEGSVTLQAQSKDGNCSLIMQIRYTGGNAVDAQLNVEENLMLNIGQQVKIDVLKWTPFDLKNDRISLSESNSSGKKVIEINTKTNTITAVNSGETKLIVQLSSEIVKEIYIVCLNKVTDIVVQENVLTAKDTYTIEAVVLPQTATIKQLEFSLQQTDIARLDGNTLHFSKPGTVIVTVRSTDGSNIQKNIAITSTLGYLSQIVLYSKEYKINKGDKFVLNVQKYPQDAVYNSIRYEIVSQTAADLSDNQVIGLSDNGEIVGLYGGTAIVRVYAEQSTEVFAECKIYVYSAVSGIELKFENEMQNYQNQSTFITSKSKIGFKVVISPQDAVIKDFTYQISDNSIAKIEGNKIIFLQKGRASIKIISSDTTYGEKSKTYNFYYVGDDIVDAKLDKTQIENNTIRLRAGESFKFKLKNVYPNDNANISFSIRDISEQRNDLNKPVASFEYGTLNALNGGQFRFTLFVNNLKLETLTLIVSVDATDILLEDGQNVYVSEPYYAVKARALPSDTHQVLLGYKLNNQNVASITQDGILTFTQLGKCTVTVYVVDNPSIFKNIEVVYTKELQAIKFNNTRDNLFVGEYIDLSVIAMPLDADKFEYEMTIDNPEVAQLTKRTGSFRLFGLSQGEVVVTAQVKNKDIKVSKTFHFYNRISDVKLELDNSGDKHGHGGYRVWGMYFVDGDRIVNTYNMNVSLYPEICTKDLLEWSSSNQSVATVDPNGTVTFHSTGTVTISVQQKVLYEGANVFGDSYEFKIVEGVNIWNFEQYKIALPKLEQLNAGRQDGYAGIVMQSDIVVDKGSDVVIITYNLHGNGYTFDASPGATNWDHFRIANMNNCVVDNVILRGTSFTHGEELKNADVTLSIDFCNNILLYNTIIENAEIGLRVLSSNITVEGCIFRNCLSVGLNITRTEDAVCDVTVKDSIFTSSFSGIFFTMDNFQNPNKSKLTLEGEVWFYNWSTLEQMQQSLDLERILREAGVGFLADEIFKQLREIASKNSTYSYKENGVEYFNFGVMLMNAKIPTNNHNSMGTIDRSKLRAGYSPLEVKGALDLAVMVPIEISLLSISATDDAFIKPKDSYIGNSVLLGLIRQPCRY